MKLCHLKWKIKQFPNLVIRLITFIAIFVTNANAFISVMGKRFGLTMSQNICCLINGGMVEFAKKDLKKQ